MHLTAVGLRPDETTALKPLGEQAQPGAGGLKHFDDVAAPATKDEDMARERLLGQGRVHLGGQAIHPGAGTGAGTTGRFLVATDASDAAGSTIATSNMT